MATGAIITRYHDWEHQLFLQIEISKTLQFRYGTFDCVLFATGLVEAMTGYDGMKAFKDKYDNPREAVKIMQSIGGLRKEIIRQIGQPINANEASRGDLIQLSNNGVGICLGNKAVVVAKDAGVTYLGRERWLYCWKIG